MKTVKFNYLSIIVAFVVIVIGIVLLLINADSNVLVSIGCSLIASGVVILFNDLLVDRVVIKPIDEWGIEKIYASRAEKNRESDPELDKAKATPYNSSKQSNSLVSA